MRDTEELHNISYALDNFRDYLSEIENEALDAIIVFEGASGNEDSVIVLKDKSEPSEDVKDLLQHGMQNLRRRLAEKLLSKFHSEIYANSCSKCGKLPKTPKAKLCTWCGHSWFN